MTRFFTVVLIVFVFNLSTSQTYIKDSETNYPVSYATISFGNGNGLFADDEGLFIFNKKLYPDIDSLYISALGYKQLVIATTNLPKDIKLIPDVNELDEVVINVKNKKKFKKEELKPYLDDDYYKCWLPTIESEIAVFFPNTDDRLKQLKSVKFPIALESRDWKKRKRANSDKRSFSTLFKVQFYEANEQGLPGDVITYETIVFRATEKDGDYHELNVENYDLYMPKNGFFVSIQVLGYTDKSGKLLPNKKYKEIKTKSGVVKIPTNFRPLLPFTDKIKTKNTYVKRVFINGNEWVRFQKGNGFKSSLLDNNLNNYGVGVTYKVYKNE